jgi:Ceramidase
MGKFSIRVKWQVLRTRLYLESLPAKAFVLPLVVFALSCAAFLTYYNIFRLTNQWGTWSVAMGNAFQYCELNRMDQLIRQPSNTWSNLAYFLVGLFALTVGVHDLKNAQRKQSSNFLVRYPVFSLMFGLSALYVFAGSFLFHASLTLTFQHLDQAGLYSVIVMVLTFNLYKIFPVLRFKGQYKSSHALLIAFALGFNYLIFTRLWLIDINVLFPALIAVAFLTSLYYLLFVSKTHYYTQYLWAAFIILLLAGIIWILDRTNVVCNPTSALQGHALWHIFTAVSMLLIYLYYRTGSVSVAEAIALREQRRQNRRLFKKLRGRNN